MVLNYPAWKCLLKSFFPTWSFPLSAGKILKYNEYDLKRVYELLYTKFKGRLRKVWL